MILDGILFRMLFAPGVMIVMGLIVLWISRFWDSKKRNRKAFLTAIVCLVYFLGTMGVYGFIYMHPQIGVLEGTLTSVRHAHGHVMSNEYVLDTGELPKRVLRLDFFTRKKILPEDFEVGGMYRLHIEERTDIIVKAERVDGKR